MQDIPNCFYRVSVKGLILDETREKFLVVLKDNGHWELPGGGLDWGELPDGCLKREIKEEMGLNVLKINKDLKYYLITTNLKQQNVINLIFETELEDLNFTPTSECREIRFVSSEEVKDLPSCPNVQDFARVFKGD